MNLEMTFAELQSDIAFERGWGRDSDDWDTRKQESLDSWVKSGLRRFLFGTTAGGGTNVYRWNFLHRKHTFTTVASQSTYNLPHDYGAPDGEILYVTDQYTPIPFRNESYVTELQSRYTDSSGTPCIAATRFKASSGIEAQLQELLLYPTPSTTYQLRLPYLVTGTMASDKRQYLPGGATHSETIRLACLAVATKGDPEGPRNEMDYQAALMASISTDSRTRSPNVGYNADDQYRHTNYSPFYVTVEGVMGNEEDA